MKNNNNKTICYKQTYNIMAKLQVDDNLLISLVQVNSLLYDRNNADYKDAILKDHVWTTIARTLNLPKLVCKSRWTMIRQRYSRVRRQLTQNLKTNTCRRSSWRFYDNLKFLNGHILPRSSIPDPCTMIIKQEDEKPHIEEANFPVNPQSPKSEHFTAASLRSSDSSFGEFITLELATFKNEYNKDKAKQNIVNIIYKYKNETLPVAD